MLFIYNVYLHCIYIIIRIRPYSQNCIHIIFILINMIIKVTTIFITMKIAMLSVAASSVPTFPRRFPARGAFSTDNILMMMMMTMMMILMKMMMLKKVMMMMAVALKCSRLGV